MDRRNGNSLPSILNLLVIPVAKFGNVHILKNDKYHKTLHPVILTFLDITSVYAKK